MNARIVCTLWIAAALACTGCLQKERVQLLYLEPDGAVTWTVMDSLVQSDEQDPAERASEELAWLLAVDRNEHPTAEALRELGATSVRARVERRQRPYTAVTEARFPSIDEAIASFLVGLGYEADAELWDDGDWMRLRVTFHEVEGGSTNEDEQSAVVELAGDPEGFRIVLTNGAFETAEGFRLERNDTVAIPLDPEGNPHVLNLTWHR